MLSPIVFTGSSIIALWDELTRLPLGGEVLNTAISGAQTPDLLALLEEVVLRHSPRVIYYYCGSNDVGNGRNPDEIIATIRQTRAKIFARLPGTKFIYLSIIEAPEKTGKLDRVREVNKAMADDAQDHRRIRFLDINPVFRTPTGETRSEFFVEDGLHLTSEAYRELGEYVLQQGSEFPL